MRMNRFKFISLLFVTMLGSLFVSCEETAEVDEYANWQERNTEYINSIAQQAQVNADGNWLKILSFKLDSIDAAGNHVKHGVEDYVYCHIEKQGEGTEHPLSTVLVNYRGRLIPTASYPEGKVFDESYKGTLNPELNKPVEFSFDKVIVGWQTALMHMVEGDIWRIYIPSDLGYGSSEKADIPAYSTLIFDINLVSFTSNSEE